MKPASHLTDPGDIARLHARDPELLAELARELSPRIWIAARHYARDDQHTDDLFQACWIHILERLESFKRPGTFGRWAIAVSKNVCLKQLRAEKRILGGSVALEAIGEVPGVGPEPLEKLQTNRLRSILDDALSSLPDRERDAIVLRVLEGMSAKEAAQILRVSVPGARSLVRKGLARLRKKREVRQAMVDWMGID